MVGEAPPQKTPRFCKRFQRLRASEPAVRFPVIIRSCAGNETDKAIQQQPLQWFHELRVLR